MIKKEKTKTLIIWIAFFAIVIILLFVLTLRPKVQKLNRNQIFEVLEEKEFTKLDITEKTTVIKITGEIKDGDKIIVFSSQIPSADIEKITEIISENESASKVVEYLNESEQNIFTNLVISIVPTLIIIVLLFFFMNRIMKNANPKGAFDVGKSKAVLRKSDIKFKDVAGCVEEKEEMMELVDYLKNPSQFEAMGARMPKGILLTGAPGTGKTMLAKALSGEAGVPFFSISGSDFVELFVGVGASRVRDMFNQAKQNAPSIIFIDEIDAVGRQRGTGIGGGHDEREQTLNQLLVEMDGFTTNNGIIIIAATNRSDVLDPALLRPGRFDRQINVSLPTKKGREDILKIHARNKKLRKNVNFTNLAERTPGFSGADLENVLNEAAILAVRRNKPIISINEIDEAIDRVMTGPAKRSTIITPEEKKRIAYHESGHAVIGLKLAKAVVVQKISIIPRGNTGGYVLMGPEEEKMLRSKKELLAEITTYLGGRASEELFFDDITSGAIDDISRATKIARTMITKLGMSSLGVVQYDEGRENVFIGRDYTHPSSNFSDKVAYEIDVETKKIMDECYQLAKKIITENKELLETIAEKLIEKETISREEIKEIDGSFEENKKRENDVTTV